MPKKTDFSGLHSEMNNEQKAQEIAYEAMDSDSPVERKRLAQKAIELDPACLDAYYILAEEYQQTEKRKEYYQKGIEAFVNKYEKKYFEENKGYFWGLLETRPYMRLCASYGRFLWELGEKAKAIQTYSELLELNPNDNQGLRYILLNWLLSNGELEKAETILNQYKEENAFMLFSELLLRIKRNPNNTNQLRIIFKKANHANPYVIKYLLNKKKLPEYLPDYYGIGDEPEAIVYCVDAKEVWDEHENAVEILKNLTDK
jgi:hypothetical protein